ncbi:MAG: biotin--[acetyl-CoA-carboxylase] ligase [Aestuariivita sp.]|nr:biotin--[acetyl-CoA-carboxylase] ligase [Aestuariivita sp.]MCY4203050.1 biotin--[acetyl-CoA-carboxylase] ligase [Aestuariivita sp.]
MTWPSGYRLRSLGTITSTLDVAASVADEISGPEWIFAERQIAARGRRGRSWVTSERNLSVALVMPIEGSLERATLRSFVAALALYDAVTAVTASGINLTIKWPNDILLNGGKLAGILLESGVTAGKVQYLAIGIGVNLIDIPSLDDLDHGAVVPVSLLNETGVFIAPMDFLQQLAIAFEKNERCFTEFGFEPIRRLWLRYAAKLGEDITVRVGGTSMTGIFETVNENGQLVLKTTTGDQTISSADVYFGE